MSFTSFTLLASLLLVVPVVAAAVKSPPSWQTVYPDTNIVVPLFGKQGPDWRLLYRDKPSDPWQGNFTARVPGDLVSDLMHNGLIHDPYTDLNLWKEENIWLGPQEQPPPQEEEADESATKPKPPPQLCQKKQTRVWSYSAHVDLPNKKSQYSWYLVVESLQMGATISWNGVFLANVTDQFLRYTLPIPTTALALAAKTNTLSVTFDPSIETDGRFMACAGGWDWAPYTRACDDQNRRIFTRGIVAPIYLVAADQFLVTHVVPKVYYQGAALPRKPMRHPDADFRVALQVHVEFTTTNQQPASKEQKYHLSVGSDFTSQVQTRPVVKTSDNNNAVMTFNLTASKDQVELWWPNGMGGQPLYQVRMAILADKGFSSNSNKHHQGEMATLASTNIKRQLATSLRSSEKDEVSWIQKKIGFRTFAIVTINETALDDESVIGGGEESVEEQSEDEEGTGLHGMYMRINGALVMARGANIIPNDQLEGRVAKDANIDDDKPNNNEKAYEIIVQSAAAANMNMIRVWGGGKVLPQSFYDACDEHGIMLYHDQMFVDENKHGPHETSTIEQEIRHMVRSLASHTSIVVWNGCNECQVVMGTKNEIYATFVMQTVAQEDDTRSIWPSSPSKYGWKTGVNRWDSRPNGKPLATRNPADHKGENSIESHGPYMRSFSRDYEGVNGVDQKFPYPSIPNKLNNRDLGLQYPSTFASEFGASVWSSFESLSGTLSQGHWSLHGGSGPDKCYKTGFVKVCEGDNVMAQRNYPCDTHIEAYFGNQTSLDIIGQRSFQAQLYQCMMAQTLWMKQDIEHRRSKNSFGLLIWQLNENWPTGGWGLIEYSADSQQPDVFKGQVLGGRWKPLMHLLKSYLFRDVMVSCGVKNLCLLRNDGMDQVKAKVSLEAWNIASSLKGSSPATFDFQATLEGGVASTALFQAPAEWGPDSYDAMLISVTDSESGGTLAEESIFLWKPLPKTTPNLSLFVHVQVKSIEVGPDKSAALVTVESDGLALYVVLTTGAPGRFLENAFALRPNQPKQVTFVSLAKGAAVDVSMLKDTVRIEHLGMYLVP
ncbi:Beta-mannosidase A [Seminavis robusta]|uniref:beta-mannosidase n=1 Tax=Seminavis robusta TaxID=568900 RepID=A0A9N8E8G8_9STRA|nr:Beta-mannosidase A [Seminavis robusta]|eukprot:Sro736_g194980.1 Beta-mannosidase A (1057) ;mRNA; f:5902-9642